jgi:hypothetical protein
MVKYKILIIALLFYNYSNAQDDNNIPLDSLSICAMKFTVDDADKIISKYGYSFSSTEKANFYGKSCDEYVYVKESEGVMQKICLYKNEKLDPFDLTLKVLYYSLFKENFDKYKEGLEADKGNIFQGEKTNGNCFQRFYQGIDFDYVFSICNTEYKNNPVYTIRIVSNNGAASLRKK